MVPVLRMFKIIATSSFLTALGCTKLIFGRSSAPDTTGGAYSALSDPIAGLRGTNSKGGGRKVKERGGERKGRWYTGPPFENFWIRPWYATQIYLLYLLTAAPGRHCPPSLTAYLQRMSTSVVKMSTRYRRRRAVTFWLAMLHEPSLCTIRRVWRAAKRRPRSTSVSSTRRSRTVLPTEPFASAVSCRKKRKKNLFATNNICIKQEKQRNNTEVSS